MSHLINILRAAHCRSTHHYFAIDALSYLRTAQSQRLASILLKHHDEYLDGAKAPDAKFKDFQNHVIHVNDRCWGGAPQKCQQWLDEAREHLDNNRWKQAAYACGVLSHYFTDPIMPLHTAQTDRERVVHRPIEWSVCQSYDAIYQPLAKGEIECQIELAADANWIGKAVLATAKVANLHYQTLLDGYSLETGCRRPAEGLNATALSALSELFALAISGLAGVLTRLADETSSELPHMSLTMTSLFATIDMPLAWILKRISDARQRHAVAAIYQEYQKTGALNRSLPDEISSVQKARTLEPMLGVEYADRLSSALVSEKVIKPMAKLGARRLEEVVAPKLQAVAESIEADVDVPSDSISIPQPGPVEIALPYDQELACDASAPQLVSLSQARQKLRIYQPDADSEVHDTVVDATTDHGDVARQFQPSWIGSGRRPHVGFQSPLIDAPSIGPKTAKRFEKIGINTIQEFVEEDSDTLALRLETRWITASLVQDWQDQARLVCEVPELSGTNAQLLVAVDCRDLFALRQSNSEQLHSRISQFGTTSEGQHILRGGGVPTITQINKWIDDVQLGDRRNVA